MQDVHNDNIFRFRSAEYRLLPHVPTSLSPPNRVVNWFKANATILSYAVAWFFWLLSGTIYYATVNFRGNFSHGFYYAVNVGYSVGWSGLTDNNNASKAFSVAYLLIGALFLTRWLVFLVENVTDDRQQRTDDRSRAIEQLSGCRWFVGTPRNVCIYLIANNQKLLIVYAWFVYVLLGAYWSCYEIHWPFLDGLYFALSSLSTGGMWSIPLLSKDYVYACVGLYTCFGVPIMGMAMGNIATLMFESRHQHIHNLPSHELTEPQSDEDSLQNVDEMEEAGRPLETFSPLSTDLLQRQRRTESCVTNSAVILDKMKCANDAHHRTTARCESASEYIISVLSNEGKISCEELDYLTQSFYRSQGFHEPPRRFHLQLPIPKALPTAQYITGKSSMHSSPKILSIHQENSHSSNGVISAMVPNSSMVVVQPRPDFHWAPVATVYAEELC